jgi:hypothetical protein
MLAVPDLPWIVYAILFAPLGLLLVAALVKSWEVREARGWSRTSGKIVVSAPEVRDVELMDREREDGHRLEKRNFANVVYEYVVGGRTLRNNRISIGEDLGNFEVARKLARYPVGSSVTVFYNPRRPEQAVLERDLPKGLWGCFGIGSAIAVVIVFGSMFGLKQSYEFFAHHIGRPDLAGLVVGFAAFGLIIALFGAALRRQAALARHWPVVPGRIKVWPMEQYREASEPGERRGKEMFSRRATYTYLYQGVSYTNECARAATAMASDTDKMLARLLARYKDGASVDVSVNPDNPAQASIDPAGDGRIAFVLWGIAAIFVALALFVATRGG